MHPHTGRAQHWKSQDFTASTEEAQAYGDQKSTDPNSAEAMRPLLYVPVRPTVSGTEGEGVCTYGCLLSEQGR